MTWIRTFEPHEHTQGVGIVIKPAESGHGLFQRILTGMTEGRMAYIVREAERLGQVLIQPKSTGDHATDLCDLKAVRQADTVMIAVWRNEHLRLVTQAAKRNRMDDPVAIALKRAAGAARGFPRQRKLTPAR
jgi:hypothetical protein